MTDATKPIRISAATRFEVFKRDRFVCTYCGKCPPNILLEVDHVLPRAAGGTNAIENLTTACFECNRGKGSRLLQEGASAPVNAETVKALRERNKQARAYAALVREEREMQDGFAQEVIDLWAQRYGATISADGSEWLNPRADFPDRTSISSYIRKIGLDRVLEAVDITSRYKPYSGHTPSRYFYGVCRNMHREQEGSSDAS